jgi:hypothetical protein
LGVRLENLPWQGSAQLGKLEPINVRLRVNVIKLVRVRVFVPSKLLQSNVFDKDKSLP